MLPSTLSVSATGFSCVAPPVCFVPGGCLRELRLGGLFFKGLSSLGPLYTYIRNYVLLFSAGFWLDRAITQIRNYVYH